MITEAVFPRSKAVNPCPSYDLLASGLEKPARDKHRKDQSSASGGSCAARAPVLSVAPSRRKREGRIISSGDNSESQFCWRVFRAKNGARPSLNTGTNTGWTAIIRMTENHEVSLWQLISRRPKRKRVSRVMHEFKHGELETGSGKKVKNPKQAIAIGLREAGASKYESKKKNRENLQRTKARERSGATEKDRSERQGGPKRTRSELYAEAKRRNIPGRSKMSKKELEHALH